MSTEPDQEASHLPVSVSTEAGKGDVQQDGADHLLEDDDRRGEKKKGVHLLEDTKDGEHGIGGQVDQQKGEEGVSVKGVRGEEQPKDGDVFAEAPDQLRQTFAALCPFTNSALHLSVALLNQQTEVGEADESVAHHEANAVAEGVIVGQVEGAVQEENRRWGELPGEAAVAAAA